MIRRKKDGQNSSSMHGLSDRIPLVLDHAIQMPGGAAPGERHGMRAFYWEDAYESAGMLS